MHLTIDVSSGNVGIGRAPATNRLEVEGNASKTTAGDCLSNSDASIKTDVTTITHALETLDRLRPVRFKYTPEYKAKHPSVEDIHYYNYIAQEYREVFPDYVQDAGEDGILQIDTYPAGVYAVAAIQGLHKLVQEKDCQIEALQEEIASMSERLARLESLFLQPGIQQGGITR